MNKLLASMAVLSLVAVVAVGCGKSTPPTTVTNPALTKVLYEPASLCGKCGQIKGTDACCVEGAAVCEKCSLHTGAPGCCKLEAGTDATLCVACGQIKGTDVCCAEGAETCPNCQLAKGSPGCCKLQKVVADADVDHDHDHDAEPRRRP